MKNPLTKETWIFILLTIACVWVVLAFVNLSPQIDYDVFFSKEDPSYKSDIDITRNFPRNDSQIIVSFGGDIFSPAYSDKVRKFGDLLMGFSGVQDVKSVAHGPKNIKHAVESPFWSRLLISNERRSSNMIVSVNADQDKFSELVDKVERLKEIFESDDFVVKLSGYPYIVDLIRDHLNRDLRVFTILSFIIFGIVVAKIFQSWRIFLGMVVACFNAAAITLIISNLLKVKIGILTANLTTIVFVLTLSDIVFLTYNWKLLYPRIDHKKAINDAIRITLPASFWSMMTTLLGFMSLLYVQAKPIRELGISGVIGTLVAMLMAYCVFPSFLILQGHLQYGANKVSSQGYKRFFSFLTKIRYIFVGLILGVIVYTLPAIKHLNTDPSLISFFSPQSPITEGLKYIDRHGGSNPLILVVQDKDGQKLYKKEPLKRLWNLHERLEHHKDVGTVLSLPPLLAEARDSFFFSFLFTNKFLLRQMEKPKYGNVSRSFISNEYQDTLFLLRMKEDGRTKHRLTIIDELQRTVRDNGFIPILTGSIYALQGQLSHHVAESLIYGLSHLIMIFAVIAFVTSLSLKNSLAMTISISLIPLGILGPIGAMNVPLDTITAPGANLAISMGIANMIHMVYAYRRLCKNNPEVENKWEVVRARFYGPIFTSMLIISCGFGIFFFSSFPPTQRFGGSIVLGTVLSAGCALFIFPGLCQFGSSLRKSLHKPKKPAKRSHRLEKLLSSNDDDPNTPLN